MRRIVIAGFLLSFFVGVPHSTWPPGVHAQTVRPRSIVFTRGITETDIFVMRPDGTGVRQITDTSKSEISPSWSPNMRRLVYESTSEGGGDTEIFTIRVDGTGRKRLTNNDDDDRNPTWSPDGRWITFDRDPNGLGEAPHPEVWRMASDGRNERRLTNNDVPDVTPGWSPRGNRIVFSHDGDIHAMRPDGSRRRRIIEGGSAEGPDWAPDGSRIAFHDVNAAGSYEIFTVKPDGTGLQQLTNNDRDDLVPSWSPNSSSLVFQALNDGGYDIAVVKRDGSRRRFLTSNEQPEFHPAWGSR